MHPSVIEFTREIVETHGLRDKSVLEVGSLNVNGTVRHLFNGPYHGIDMQDGPGVDEVCDAHELERREEFDVVVCTEMLEHDSAPWFSLWTMQGAVRSGGHLILTCRGYDDRGCFPLHDYPSDLWRFSCDGIRHMLDQAKWTPTVIKPDPEAPGVFAHAQRT